MWKFCVWKVEGDKLLYSCPLFQWKSKLSDDFVNIIQNKFFDISPFLFHTLNIKLTLNYYGEYISEKKKIINRLDKMTEYSNLSAEDAEIG